MEYEEGTRWLEWPGRFGFSKRYTGDYETNSLYCLDYAIKTAPTLIREHDREYYVIPKSNGGTLYIFIDQKVTNDGKWVYQTCWYPATTSIEEDTTYYLNYFPWIMGGYGVYAPGIIRQGDTPIHNDSFMPCTTEGVMISDLLLESQNDAPETIIIPKSIGGRPVVCVTGDEFSSGLRSPNTKIFYVPNGCYIKGDIGPYFGKVSIKRY